MNTPSTFTTGGNYGSFSISGSNRNLDVGLIVHVPEHEIVALGDVEIGNVFIPLIKTGPGRLTWNSLRGYDYGGDLSNLRAGNILGEHLVSRHNTPTRPYKTCVREGSESIAACLLRNGEEVYDSRLLSFSTHKGYPGKQVIKGYHCDGVAQIYAVKENGYSLDPNGVVSNIIINSIDAKLNGKNTQGVMASECNRHTRIYLGRQKYHIQTDGYRYHTVFNQLDTSSIGGKDNRVSIGSQVRIHASKPTKHQSFGNQFIHFNGSDISYE